MAVDSLFDKENRFMRVVTKLVHIRTAVDVFEKADFWSGSEQRVNNKGALLGSFINYKKKTEDVD